MTGKINVLLTLYIFMYELYMDACTDIAIEMYTNVITGIANTTYGLV